MTEEMKKYVAIALAVICLLIAGTIAYRTMFGGGSAGSGSNRDVVLLCTKCGGFEISADEFREIMSKNADPMMMGMPGQPMVIPCPKCGQKTCYLAQKCPQCENIFVMGQARDQNYPDRCPKCSFSAIEDRQKNR